MSRVEAYLERIAELERVEEHADTPQFLAAWAKAMDEALKLWEAMSVPERIESHARRLKEQLTNEAKP